MGKTSANVRMMAPIKINALLIMSIQWLFSNGEIIKLRLPPMVVRLGDETIIMSSKPMPNAC
jgi:hypothetical protein